MLQPISPSPMPLRAINLLRENVRHLLRVYGKTKTDLAFYLRVHKSAITKFLNGSRPIHIEHLDRIADFFGLSGDTYKLFQPGLSDMTDRRRKNHERRSGQDRRISHLQRLEQAIRPVPPAALPDEDREFLRRFKALNQNVASAIKHLMTLSEAKVAKPLVAQRIHKQIKAKKSQSS